MSNEYVILNADGFSYEVEGRDNDRINKVFNHLRKHFQEVITLNDIADQVSMTEPSFCRYFKKLTSKTFVQFLNEYRLVHASKLLAEKKLILLKYVMKVDLVISLISISSLKYLLVKHLLNIDKI